MRIGATISIDKPLHNDWISFLEVALNYFLDELVVDK
jgi:hypothetical protein